jgi:hypothetical protein
MIIVYVDIADGAIVDNTADDHGEHSSIVHLPGTERSAATLHSPVNGASLTTRKQRSPEAELIRKPNAFLKVPNLKVLCHRTDLVPECCKGYSK